MISDPRSSIDSSGLAREAREGLEVGQVFSNPAKHPFDEVVWEKRTAKIGDDKGGIVFEQKDVEIPAEWSQLATNVVVSKYFYGENGKPEREHSVRQLVHRVCRTIADWAKEDGLFATDDDAERWYQRQPGKHDRHPHLRLHRLDSAAENDDGNGQDEQHGAVFSDKRCHKAPYAAAPR